jgi:hypothetical protein
VALIPRSRPPVIESRAPALAESAIPRTLDEARAAGGSFRFVVENIHANAPVGVRMANAPPVGEGLVIEFYMNPQRTAVDLPEPPLLVGRRAIGADGRVEMELPAGVPLFELLRRRDGTIAMGRDNQIFHVGGMNFGVAGETARCVGCHAGHSLMEVPDDPLWTNIAPSAVVTATSAASVVAGSTRLTLAPELLVDRHIDPLFSEWGSQAASAVISFHWNTPILARELVVYAPQGASQGISIHAFTFQRSLSGSIVERRRVQGRLRRDGTRVPLDPEAEFNRLEIEIATGDYSDAQSPALAEVEVIGRLARDPNMTGHALPILRGDADCDRRHTLSDAVALLDLLFRGGRSVCCELAGDVNDSGKLDVTDAIHLLAWLYGGGAPPEPPSEKCGAVTLSPGGLSCDRTGCQ